MANIISLIAELLVLNLEHSYCSGMVGMCNCCRKEQLVFYWDISTRFVKCRKCISAHFDRLYYNIC